MTEGRILPLCLILAAAAVALYLWPRPDPLEVLRHYQDMCRADPELMATDGCWRVMHPW